MTACLVTENNHQQGIGLEKASSVVTFVTFSKYNGHDAGKKKAF
jgi:hypothetical protein